MESREDIKRGIDFAVRAGETTYNIRKSFVWWSGGRFSGKTWQFLGIVWMINMLVIFPLFGKDLNEAYVNSPFLLFLQDAFRSFIKEDDFFRLITFIFLSLAPISFYLFARKIVMRHEITAFIATLLFFLPNFFVENKPVLVASLLKGDGGHVVAFSLIPLILLYAQGFVSSGSSVLLFISAICFAFIYMISPFAGFNFTIIFGILVISNGLKGNLRIKLVRAAVFIFISFMLTFFWYSPGYVQEFFTSAYVRDAIDKLMRVMPLALPMIPVIGVLVFLVFDRRERLNSVFVSSSFFLVYVFIYRFVGSLGISGMFGSERYIPEMMMAISLVGALAFVFLIELAVRKILVKRRTKRAFFIGVLVLSFLMGLVLFGLSELIFLGRMTIRNEIVDNMYMNNQAMGSGMRNFSDHESIISIIVSVVTLVFLMVVTKRYFSKPTRELAV